MSDAPITAEKAQNVWASLDPAEHCFREDNCADHSAHLGHLCCCCQLPARDHTGCDCD